MRRVLGYAVISLGVLITGLSGLCTLFFVPVMLDSHDHAATSVGTAGLVIGGVALLTGLGFLLLGRSLLPRSPPSDKNPR